LKKQLGLVVRIMLAGIRPDTDRAWRRRPDSRRPQDYVGGTAQQRVQRRAFQLWQSPGREPRCGGAGRCVAVDDADALYRRTVEVLDAEAAPVQTAEQG